MKKLLLIVIMASGLVACAQQPTESKNEAHLKKAYSACINNAKGNADKVEACRSVLEVLKEDQNLKAFTDKESVSVLEYNDCLQATRTGNDQAVRARCDQIWEEIRSNNAKP